MPRTTTDTLKTTIAQHLAGESTPALEVVEAAFGTGGVDAFGNLRSAEPTRTALRSEVHRNDNVAVTRNGTIVTALVRISGDEAGTVTISEAGIFAAGNKLLAYATFEPREIGPGTQLDFRFRI